MTRYYFRIVDTHSVSDHGVRDLVDETEARIEAGKLARSLRSKRPELLGRDGSISVTDETGTGICVIPIDDI
jgi:hypothetical protein